MKKRKNLSNWKYAICSLAAAGLVFLSLPAQTRAEGMDAAELQRKFPAGAYWNHVVQEGHDLSYFEDPGACNNPDGYTWHPCTAHFVQPKIGQYDCNSFESIQCYGFAAKLTYDVYGSTYYEWPEKIAMPMDKVKTGDVIFYHGDGAGEYGHRAMILDIDGTKIRVGECNWGRRCQISWGRWLDVTNTKWYTIYSAPYPLPGGGRNAVTGFMKGDIDGDKERTIEDAHLALLAALRIKSFNSDELCSADMDGNGTVSLDDAQFLLKAALKIVRI